jgi:hypothetical protein
METSILGEPSKFQFSIVMGQSKQLIATKKEKKKWEALSPHLMNWNMDILSIQMPHILHHYG